LEGKEDRPKNNAICVIALSYAKGPTVESLLQHGGALSNVFGRVILAQAVDTVAYMHYRGVLHRDIKPDNIMVTGKIDYIIVDYNIMDDLFVYFLFVLKTHRYLTIKIDVCEIIYYNIPGAFSKDDEIWDDEGPSSKSKNWDELRKKWKVYVTLCLVSF
jgi:serine/threonine protein kinase